MSAFGAVLAVLAAFVAGILLSLTMIDTIEPWQVNAMAVVVGLATFLWSARQSRVQQRQQHTITILFQTRLSPEFRETLTRRKRSFAEGEAVSYDTYRTYLTAARNTDLTDDEALSRRESAEAIRTLLNYYEFIALGVARRDLDEGMLRGSIRGIMCALVVDMADILRTEQARNPLAYRNLTALFQRWRVHEPDLGFEVAHAPIWARLRQHIAAGIAP